MTRLLRTARPILLAAAMLPSLGATTASDWVNWRGPARDGVSTERGLPERWSPAGENLAWRAPYGGRSAPIVLGDRVCLQNTAGERETVQERIVCLDANSGKPVWEYRFNVFLSDVPPHRVGWSSPVADPSTGHLYAFGVGATLVALSRDGKRLWERSLVEDFGAITTHGGRTVSPIIEGDLVIVSTLNSGWGDQTRGSNRWFAFDKRTGETVWVSSPQARHYDTGYSCPIAATINGTRLIIVGGTDGTIHALKAQTGEPVWKYEISKRAINTNVVLHGTDAIVTQSEENLDTSEMGLVAAIDATATGTIAPAQVRWRTTGWQGGFSSPVIDGSRIYQVDNGAVLGAFDLASGRRLWTQHLGTIQKASLVLGDGKLYVGTENGRFYILRPGPDTVEILDDDQLGAEGAPEPIIGSVAVSNGRVYLVSGAATYAIGRKAALGATASGGAGAGVRAAPTPGDPAYVQVVPYDSVVHPGAPLKLRARLFDGRGNLLREERPVWTLEQLRGTIGSDGTFVAAADAGGQAGLIRAAVGPLAGTSRVRVVPRLPLAENFDGATGDAPPRHWINAAGKFVVRDVDGNKVLVKLADNPFTKRARMFVGTVDSANYTVEADVRAIEKRRQMGDAGLIAQRYALVLFGNSQEIELQSWQPSTAKTVSKKFAWKADTWYRVKLRVENAPDGSTRVQGKVWPAAEPEPAAWTAERLDRLPHRQGSPGIYADAPNEVFFDNIKVIPNS